MLKQYNGNQNEVNTNLKEIKNTLNPILSVFSGIRNRTLLRLALFFVDNSTHGFLRISVENLSKVLKLSKRQTQRLIKKLKCIEFLTTVNYGKFPTSELRIPNLFRVNKIFVENSISQLRNLYQESFFANKKTVEDFGVTLNYIYMNKLSNKGISIINVLDERKENNLVCKRKETLHNFERQLVDTSRGKSLHEVLKNVVDNLKVSPEQVKSLSKPPTSLCIDFNKTKEVYDLNQLLRTISISAKTIENPQKGNDKVDVLRLVTLSNTTPEFKNKNLASFWSYINPKLISRYRSISDMNLKMNHYLRSIGVLYERDRFITNESGEYILTGRRSIKNCLKRINTSFFGTMLILALGDKIVNLAYRVCVERKRIDKDTIGTIPFNYFMLIAAEVVNEIYKPDSTQYREFITRYDAVLDLLVDMRANRQSLVVDKNVPFSPSLYDIKDFLQQRAIAKREENNAIRKENIDDKTNARVAEVLTKFEGLRYNPNCSRDERAGVTKVLAKDVENSSRLRDTRSYSSEPTSRLASSSKPNTPPVSEYWLNYFDQFKDRIVKDDIN